MTGRRAAAWALYGLTLAAVFTIALSTLTRFDFWWFLKSGELILETGTVPRTDPFSYTAEGRPWVNHMWATQALLALGWHRWGRIALLLAKAAIVSATFAVVLATVRGRGVHPILASGVCLLAAWAGLGFWEVRPQVITYLFTAVYLWLLRDGWTRRRALWWAIPLLMMAWANLHAGFVTGLGLIGLIGFGTAMEKLWALTAEAGSAGNAAAGTDGQGSEGSRGVLRRMARREARDVLARTVLLTGLALLASLVNPYGIRALLFPFEVVGTKAFLSSTLEWFSPDFHNPIYRGFEAMLLLVLPAVAWGRGGLRLTDLLLLGGLAHLGLVSLRHIPLFAVAAAPPLAVGLQGLVRALRDGYAGSGVLTARLREGLPSLGRLAASPVLWLGAAAGALLLVLGLYWVAFLGAPASPFALDLEERRYPREAVTFIDANALPAPLFNVYVWGGYELWRLYPRYRVFIDGRTHVYGPEVLEDFLAVTNVAPHWATVLDRWKVQTILAPRPSVLVEVLTAVGGWRLVFGRQGTAAVFVRDTPANRDLLDRLARSAQPPVGAPGALLLPLRVAADLAP